MCVVYMMVYYRGCVKYLDEPLTTQFDDMRRASSKAHPVYCTADSTIPIEKVHIKSDNVCPGCCARMYWMEKRYALSCGRWMNSVSVSGYAGAMTASVSVPSACMGVNGESWAKGGMLRLSFPNCVDRGVVECSTLEHITRLIANLNSNLSFSLPSNIDCSLVLLLRNLRLDSRRAQGQRADLDNSFGLFQSHIKNKLQQSVPLSSTVGPEGCLGGSVKVDSGANISSRYDHLFNSS